MKKSQSATEFIVLTSFMMLVILSFVALTSSRLLESSQENNQKTAEDIAAVVYNEVESAKTLHEGFSRVFELPERVNGATYVISIVDSRELIVSYQDTEFVKFLPPNVSGNVSRGPNEISKSKGVIYLSPVT